MRIGQGKCRDGMEENRMQGGGDQGKGRGDGIQYQRGMKSLSRKMQN